MDSLEIEILAESVGNLQYDVTGEVVSNISEILREEAEKNTVTKSKYISAADNLVIAKNYIFNAWRICERKMDEEERAKHPRAVPGYNGAKDISLKIFKENSTMLFISILADDLWTQAYFDDILRGRKRTATNLYAASERLHAAAEDLYVKLIK